MYPFSIYRIFNPRPKHIWVQIRILYETDKALLVECGSEIWISKSQIYGIRLRKGVFEIYVRESIVG